MYAMEKGEVDINIRPMERKDIDAVLAIDRRISPTRSIFTRRELSACDPGGPLDLSFVAEVENETVGFILFCIVADNSSFWNFTASVDDRPSNFTMPVDDHLR